jgi:biopolymer transport protein ExbD
VAQQDNAKNSQLILEANGQVTFEGQQVSDKDLGQLLKDKSSTPQFQLQVSADKAVPYGRVAEIMAIAQGNGVTKMSFVSVPSRSK